MVAGFDGPGDDNDIWEAFGSFGWLGLKNKPTSLCGIEKGLLYLQIEKAFDDICLFNVHCLLQTANTAKLRTGLESS